MPNNTEVNAAPDQVIGLVQAVPTRLGNYDFTDEYDTTLLGRRLGTDFMHTVSNIVSNLVKPEPENGDKPRARSNVVYQNNHGIVFRRVTEVSERGDITTFRDNLRFLYPETSTSPYKLVQINYVREKFDAMENPRHVPGSAATLDIALARHRSLLLPETKLHYMGGSSKTELNHYDKPTVIDGKTPIEPHVPGVVSDIVDAIHIAEVASDRSFVPYEGEFDLAITGGYSDIAIAKRDPYDTTYSPLVRGLAAAAFVSLPTPVRNFASAVWNGSDKEE
jgi:hypothetical protein